MKSFLQSIVFILLILSGNRESYSQTDKKYIREGNNHFEKSEFDQSEISYRKALEEQSDSYKALFNLGDALYKQDKFEDAAGEFNTLSQTGIDKISRARSFHNLGNSLLKANRIEESIHAYKNALRNYPDDLETKFNLAYAQDLLKQQQQQKEQDQDNSEKDNREQEDKEKDQKDQQQNEQQQQQDQQQEQQPESQISKEDAKRLLEALAEDEKELQEKLKKAEARKNRVVVRKNW